MLRVMPGVSCLIYIAVHLHSWGNADGCRLLLSSSGVVWHMQVAASWRRLVKTWRDSTSVEHGAFRLDDIPHHRLQSHWDTISCMHWSCVHSLPNISFHLFSCACVRADHLTFFQHNYRNVCTVVFYVYSE